MERFSAFTSDQIIFTKRQISMIMASMLLFCLSVFIVGFFLGKKAVIDEFSANVSKQAVHDQIDFLLTTQSLQSLKDEPTASTDSKNENSLVDDAIPAAPVDLAIYNPEIMASFAQEKSDDTADSKDQKAVIKAEPVASAVIMSEKNLSNLPVLDTLDTSKSASGQVYAQLIGFGTKKAAQAFVARLKKHNMTVILKTMMSKTSSGVQKSWYQAITPTYDSMQQLQEQVKKIKRLEHIKDKDIKIVSIKK